MNEPSLSSPPPLGTGGKLLRFALIGAILLFTVLAFGYVGGWLAPQRLTAQRLVNQLQTNAGVFPGYRRNHAKGVCVMGYFESNGQLQPYSSAQVFAPGRTPVVGRFAVPGGNPYAPDSSVPIRSMALRFNQANGQQWRTGMNSMPVFPVATPQAFFEQLQAQQPDPATGKPNPKNIAAFFAAHPEAAAFLAWVKTAKPSSSYATETYWSLNAFVLVDAQGEKHPVRWRMVSENGDATPGGANPDYLDADLAQRLTQGPQRWHLLFTLANPGDPTNDATKIWPSDRRDVDAGTLVLTATEPQQSGPCRDINYDPLILPNGIEASDDPLLPARSAAYATSYLRRTSEEARLPGTAHTQQEARQ
ncbi:catalase family peroxidase [Dyella mobilis]|uniref:Catalase-related peroxidase n=1 Tax=Dyella mobilis TaxID=1849582 RepID=A0ABS2KIT7_9GAMM|nr:catalase family peroxidase [Dyella mobilis]MBM7131070.1 catalase family peroxidase [Dyella mobilis]GLQ97697.1 catalase-related peroxidase [Dyella mobilis]